MAVWNGVVERVAWAVNKLQEWLTRFSAQTLARLTFTTVAAKDVTGAFSFERAGYMNMADAARAGYATGRKFEDFLGNIGSPNGAFWYTGYGRRKRR